MLGDRAGVATRFANAKIADVKKLLGVLPGNREWIAKNWKRRNGTQAVMRARQFFHPITRQELDAIADVWVDAALRLDDKDLRMMGRIVRSQMRRLEHGDVEDITAEVRAEEALAAVG